MFMFSGCKGTNKWANSKRKTREKRLKEGKTFFVGLQKQFPFTLFRGLSSVVAVMGFGRIMELASLAMGC